MRVRLGIVAFRARTAWDTPTKARALIRPMWPAVRRTTPDSHHRTRRHRGPTHATISPKVSFRSGVDEVFSKPIVAGQRALSSFHTLSPSQPICGSRLSCRTCTVFRSLGLPTALAGIEVLDLTRTARLPTEGPIPH